MTDAKRAAIVAEALSWEGTPYHHRAALKGIGADCAMFPLAVYIAQGYIPALTTPDYSPQWMLHRDEEHFLGHVRAYAREIGRGELGPGDFAIWRFGRCYSHGAIVIEPPRVIHAVAAASAVVRADMDREHDLASRPVKFFSVFGRG